MYRVEEDNDPQTLKTFDEWGRKKMKDPAANERVGQYLYVEAMIIACGSD